MNGLSARTGFGECEIVRGMQRPRRMYELTAALVRRGMPMNRFGW